MKRHGDIFDSLFKYIFTNTLSADRIIDQHIHWRHWCAGEALVLVAADVLHCAIGLQQGVFDEDRKGSQDEGGEQIHMDVVPHAMQFPDKWRADSKGPKGNISFIFF